MLSSLSAIGPLAWRGLKFVNDKTDGKFARYLGGKFIEWGARGTKKLLDKANSEKANNVAKKAAEAAMEAAKEITGDDSYVTRNVTKAANIIAPGTVSQTVALATLPIDDNVPYSKRLYGSNFQRYEPKTIHKVKIIKKKRHGRILQDINAK